MSAQPLIQVINLDRDKRRLHEIASELAAADLVFKRLPAVDGASAASTEPASAKRVLGRDLYPGEIGCYLSHLRAIDNFLETDAQYGVVLEDDAVPGSSTANRLAELFEILPKAPPWDVVNLGRPPKSVHTLLSSDSCNPSVGLYHAHYPPVTTTALLWSRHGAKAFRKSHSLPIMPIDLALQSWGTKTDRILALEQPLFFSREVQSTIRASSRHSGGRGIYSVLVRIRRIISNKVRAYRNRKLRRGN